MSTPPPLVRLERVTRTFDEGAVVALDHLDLSIAAGDCVAIVGASGSGKSSLINMMSGIDTPSSGLVWWNGRPVTARREWADLRANHIGIVFQEFNLIPTLTARENVELALFGHGLSPGERRTRATDALGRVGLAARQQHLPHAMSGGERQRVAIARSIVNDPRLLLADEPTGNLDSANGTMVADLLLDLQRSIGVTLVFVTHEEALAQRCRRRVHIKDGRVAADTVTAEVTPLVPRSRA